MHLVYICDALSWIWIYYPHIPYLILGCGHILCYIWMTKIQLLKVYSHVDSNIISNGPKIMFQGFLVRVDFVWYVDRHWKKCPIYIYNVIKLGSLIHCILNLTYLSTAVTCTSFDALNTISLFFLFISTVGTRIQLSNVSPCSTELLRSSSTWSKVIKFN